MTKEQKGELEEAFFAVI